jgi:signal transduction histidine kinase
MEIAIAALSIILILVLILHISFRRQVGGLVRQLRFIKENETRLRLTSSNDYKELKQLIEEVNSLVNSVETKKSALCQKENEISETITSLSHDIRTPLTSLDGYFQLLSSDDVSAGDKKRYIGIIKNRIDALNNILDELFTFAKLNDEGFTLETERINLTEIVTVAAFSFYEDFKNIGAEPVIDIPEKPMYINGNSEALMRVFQNIMKNALTHGTDIKITLTENEGKAIYSCENSFDKTVEIDTEHIFDRFYKADKSRNEKGTGLGLSIAKGLCEKMKGEISAKAENESFSITVEFPL